jgi:hypothetical protein
MPPARRSPLLSSPHRVVAPRHSSTHLSIVDPFFPALTPKAPPRLWRSRTVRWRSRFSDNVAARRRMLSPRYGSTRCRHPTERAGGPWLHWRLWLLRAWHLCKQLRCRRRRRRRRYLPSFGRSSREGGGAWSPLAVLHPDGTLCAQAEGAVPWFIWI